MKKDFLILFSVLTVLLALIYSCQREYTPHADQDRINDFFQRKQNRKTAFGLLNKDRGTDYLLNKSIYGFKQLNIRNAFANKLTNKYGLPQWDLSLVAQNKNKLFTIITPFINETHNVTALLFAYQATANRTVYRIINTNNYKRYFGEQGNKDASIVNRSTIEGLLSTFEKIAANADQLEQLTGTTGRSVEVISWYCWRYTWSDYTADHPTVGATSWQCVYSIHYYDQGGTSPGTGDPELPIDYESGVDPDSGEVWVYEETHLEEDLIDTIKLDDVQDTCMKELVIRLTSEGLNNKISRLFSQVFTETLTGGTPEINFKYSAFLPAEDSLYGKFKVEFHPIRQKNVFEIALNSNNLGTGSPELATVVILHEMMHALFNNQELNYLYMFLTDDHANMAELHYMNLMAASLQEFFPALSLEEAMDLSWIGLTKTNRFLLLPLADRTRIKNRENEHYSKNTLCN